MQVKKVLFWRDLITKKSDNRWLKFIFRDKKVTRVVGSPASQGDASSWVVFRPSTRCACLGTKNHPALGISLFSRAAHSLFTFLSLQINFRHRPLCFVLRSLQKKYVVTNTAVACFACLTQKTSDKKDSMTCMSIVVYHCIFFAMMATLDVRHLNVMNTQSDGTLWNLSTQ